mgnify:CR=1 FL=1
MGHAADVGRTQGADLVGRGRAGLNSFRGLGGDILIPVLETSGFKQSGPILTFVGKILFKIS